MIDNNQLLRFTTAGSVGNGKSTLIDSYRENRTTGFIILVDDATTETVAAGMTV